MDIQIKELSAIEPGELDEMLALGWFRIQQTIFTTNTLQFNGTEYRTIWLRVRLRDLQPGKKYFTLQKKNSPFRTEIKKAKITPRHEKLYSSYKESTSFESASSLQEILYGYKIINVYNTYLIEMYDGNKLIGAGFFDIGKTSAAGISSIYDPAYKKYSIGKFLIYEKMMYCKKENLTYFYPGYYVPGYPAFDYKLEIGNPYIEYFDPYNKKWFLFETSFITKNGFDQEQSNK